MDYVQYLAFIGMLVTSSISLTASDNDEASLIATRREVLVKEGSSLKLSCTVLDAGSINSSMLLSWMKQNDGLHDSYVAQNGVSYNDCCEVTKTNRPLSEVNLLIKNVGKEDNGTWICFAPGIKIPAATRVFVTDSDDPLCSTSHNLGPGNTLIQGSNISLSCYTTNNVISQHSLLTWMKNGHNITSEWSNTLSYSYKTSADDNGANFTCILQNRILESTWTCNGSITIDVQYPPEVFVFKSACIGRTGDPKLICNVTEGNPAITTVEWMSPDGNRVSNNHILSNSGDVKLSEGNYTCVANNTYVNGSQGRSFSHTSIKLIGDPIVTTKQEINVEEGDNVTLECNVTSQDASEVGWHSAKGEYKNGKILVLQNVSALDSGVYKCTVNNRLCSNIDGTTIGWNNTFVRVYLKPYTAKVTLTGKQSENSEDILILRCEANVSNPEVSISWYRDNDLINDKSGYGIRNISSESEHNGVIIKQEWQIRTTPELSASIISCAATNLAFNQTKVFSEEVVIKHDYSPRSMNCDETSSITVGEGENATLTCNINSFPRSSIQWYHLNRTVLTGSKYFIQDQPLGTIIYSTLLIIKTSSSDSGEYSCKAENRKGNTTLTFSLTVRASISQTDVTIMAAIIFLLVFVATIMVLVVCATVTGMNKAKQKTGNQSEPLERKLMETSLMGNVQQETNICAECSKTKTYALPRKEGIRKRTAMTNTDVIYTGIPSYKSFGLQPPFLRHEAALSSGERYTGDLSLPHASNTEYDLQDSESMDQFDLSSQQNFCPYEIADLDEILQCYPTELENPTVVNSLSSFLEHASGGESDLNPYELLQEPIPPRGKRMSTTKRVTEGMRNNLDTHRGDQGDCGKYDKRQADIDTARLKQQKYRGGHKQKSGTTLHAKRQNQQLNVEGLRYAELDLVRPTDFNKKSQSMPVKRRSDRVQYALIDQEKTQLLSVKKASTIK